MLLESQGRINNNTPYWLPDAERSGSLFIKQGLLDNRLYVGVEGRQSFDLLENHYVGIKLGGRFGN